MQRCASQLEYIHVYDESRKKLRNFMNTMFKISRGNFANLLSPEEFEFIGNQTNTLTDSIVNSLNGKYFAQGNSSCVMGLYSITDHHYDKAIWRFFYYIVVEIILIYLIVKLFIKRKQ